MAQVKVLVTGGDGFVGRAIVKALLHHEPTWHITVLDNRHDGLGSVASGKVDFVPADVTLVEDLRKAIASVKPRAIIHTAGIVPPFTHRYTRVWENAVKKVNVDGTRNMLAVAGDFDVKAFVYTSSCCAVTDDFTGHYASKRYHEQRQPE